METKITFIKLHGETEWLIKPVKTDGTRITDEEIDQLVEELNKAVVLIGASAFSSKTDVLS